MPVYLLTIHAYRSWQEDRPKGYVQRGQGLQAPDPQRAKWRNDHAKHPPARFTKRQQQRIHDLAKGQFTDDAELYACSTTPTHIHLLLAFHHPPCDCEDVDHCGRLCPARSHVEDTAAQLKRKVGPYLSRDADVTDCRWFSRGCDITPVRDREHLTHLIEAYLPDHERKQHGIYRHYH